MRHAALAIAALSSALACSPAFAKQEPVLMAAVGEWEYSEGPDFCSAVRGFGEGRDQNFVRLDQFGPSKAFGLSVVGPAMLSFLNFQATELHFREGQKRHQGRPFTGIFEGLGKGVIYSSITPDWDELEQLAKAGTPRTTGVLLDPAVGGRIEFVALKQSSRPEVRLVTGSMAEVFTALNACSLRLLENWGHDAERFRTAQNRPSMRDGNKHAGALRKAYRKYALQGERGALMMHGTVSEHGALEDCTLTAVATTGNLAPAICEVLMQAEFNPAIDAAGRPFRTLYQTMLSFYAE